MRQGGTERITPIILQLLAMMIEATAAAAGGVLAQLESGIMAVVDL
jgi:hypothetical protein